MGPRQTIIVYRDTLLPPSETFIRGQAESLNRFRPQYVCLRHTSGLSLPESRVHPLCQGGIVGRVQRARFKLLGPNLDQQRAVATQNAVLFHAHFAPDACDAMPLVRALGIPLVVSLHGYDVNSDDNHLPRLYLRRREQLKSDAIRFICISEFIRKQALAKGFPTEKTVVHYTGIDTAFFCADSTILRLPIVLFVGRLAPGKGCEYLIRAMARVQEVMPETKLIVLGQGPQRKQLERQAAALLHNFEFLGVQSPTKVRDWMNRAKVFSSPCFVTPGAQEGFGMAFAEAQAMGLPVVSSSIGGIPEAVAHEQTGFLVPERDSAAIAAKLLVLLRNRDLWTKFSEAGRTRVHRMFNIRKQAALLENIYDSVLEERKWKAGAKANRDGQQRSSHVPIEA
jgi:glycosyltransferase involved in cell wall biosynthesis